MSKVYKAHCPSVIGMPLEPLKSDAERMSIGTLDEPDERRRGGGQRFRVCRAPARRSRRRWRCSVGRRRRPRAPTTDEWALDWDDSPREPGPRRRPRAAPSRRSPWRDQRPLTRAAASCSRRRGRAARRRRGRPLRRRTRSIVQVVRPAALRRRLRLVLNKFPAFPTTSFDHGGGRAPARRLDRDDLDALHRCASGPARSILHGILRRDVGRHAGGEGPRLCSRDGGRVAALEDFQIVPGSASPARWGRGAAADFLWHIEALPRDPWRWSGRGPSARRADAAAARGRRARRRAPAAGRRASASTCFVRWRLRIDATHRLIRVDFSTDGAFADALLRRPTRCCCTFVRSLNGESHNLRLPRLIASSSRGAHAKQAAST